MDLMGKSLFWHRATAVWAVLVVATCVSWWVGHDRLLGLGITGSSVAVLVLALVKVRLVGVHFMELRDAPRALRAGFEAYVIVLGGLLIGLFLAA